MPAGLSQSASAQVVHHVATSQQAPRTPRRAEVQRRRPVIGVAGVCQAVHRAPPQARWPWEHMVEQVKRRRSMPRVSSTSSLPRAASHTSGELGAAGRAILDRVRLRWETVRIVHLTRRGVALHERSSREPVSRDGENRARLVCRFSRLSRADRAPPRRRGAHHRIAVADKHRHLPSILPSCPPLLKLSVIATWYLFCTYRHRSILHSAKCHAIVIF